MVRGLSTVTDIKMDYDGRVPADFDQRLALLCHVFRLTPVVVRFDRTRHGYHCIVTVRRRLAPWRIIVAQLALGSDWKRELFNSRRVTAWRNVPSFWRERWNVLYSRHYRSKV
jgi:hypothetical protein